MKSRFFYLAFAFIALPGISMAQPRHSKGLGMLGAEYGINSQSYCFGIGYQRYFSDKVGFKGRMEYYRTDFPISDYSSYVLGPEFCYTLLSNYRNIYFNGKTGASLGYETLENEVFSEKSRLFYGEFIGLSLEMFIRYNVKAEISLEQRFLQRSLISKHHPRMSIGIYFLLN